MRTVIFDLDGTLADTSADLIAAANVCFRARGHGDVLDPAGDALTAFHGGRAMLALGYGRLGLSLEDHLAEDVPRLLEAYRDGIDRQTRLYPGAVDAVRALRSSGWATGICTNKPAGLAELLLSRLGVRDLFTSMIGADTLPVRKPDPAPYRAAVEGAGGQVAQSVLIGDTVTDVATARAAGVPVVLVGFGPEGAGVARLSPDALLSDYASLPAIVERLLPRRAA